jgi:simple sugar transport system permease protein
MIRVTGNNLDFAKYSGLPVVSTIVFSQLIGSSIAGLGGAVEILGGIDGRFSWKALPGFGFDGFIVAILAGNNPVLVPLAALFLSYLRTGAVLMSLDTDIASEFIQIIQALIIIIVAGQAFMRKLRNRVLNKKEKSIAMEEVKI